MSASKEPITEEKKKADDTFSAILSNLRQRDVVKRLLVLLAVVICISAFLWWQGPALANFFRDEEQVKQWIERLGWFGPLALILLNTLQIVVAPIPGYFVQAAAGYLYGPVWGGIWATVGLFCGSMLAMSLTRRFGRPLAVAMIGADRLDHWEATTHSTSPFVWFLLIFAPLGDLPYFLAGLSRVGYRQIALTTLIVRSPTVFAWAAIGAGVVVLEWWQMAMIFALLGLILALFLRYQSLLMGWLNQTVQQRLQREQNPVE